MVNKKRLIKLTQKLIQINSENPPGDESKIALFVKDYLGRLGVKTKIYDFKDRRSNVVSLLEGENKKRSLLITPHLDTVPAGKSWHFNPFEGTVSGAKIYGLGATDCKGNLACGLEAINSIVEDGVKLGYNLIFSATADEESGSGLGLIPLLNKGILKADAVVVLDADDFNIIITQKGLIHFKVKIQGQKAHGAYPWQGVNAIDIAVEIIKELKSHKFGYTKNKYLKPPTINIGTIKGGDKVNVVSDWCEFEVDIRFLPGESAEAILKYIQGLIQKHIKSFSRHSGFPLKAGKVEIEGIQEPYWIDPKQSLVRYFKAAAKKFNIHPEIEGSEGATTITFFQDEGIPAIATGFGSIGCAHIADEYAQVNNLYKGAMVLEEFLKIYRFDS